jgi:hypothetical protein
MDHIKNALTKTKNPPKKFKIAPQFFRPKKDKKRPQTLQKDLKNENKGQIVIFGFFFVFFLGEKPWEIFVFFGGIFGFS